MPSIENTQVPRPTKYVGSVNGIFPDRITKALSITGEAIPTTKEEGSKTIAEDIGILYNKSSKIKDGDKILTLDEQDGLSATLSLEEDPDTPLTYNLV
jgi:hypothetical protein